MGPERLLDLLLRAGAYGDRFDDAAPGLSLAKLQAAAHGVDLGPLAPRLPAMLATASGRIELAPDLLVGFAAGYSIGAAPTVIAPNTRKWSADHASFDYASIPGTLISSQPTTTDSPRVIDIAPTVLRYFGVPIPREVDGTPLF